MKKRKREESPNPMNDHRLEYKKGLGPGKNAELRLSKKLESVQPHRCYRLVDHTQDSGKQ